MQYISPASLFGEAFQLSPDKKTIQLERKKLLAELELNDTESIVVHNIVLTKNDIIQYCEELLQKDVIEYHAAIQRDTALLIFLERSLIDFKQKFRNNDLYSNPDFIRWVSPYFALSFKTCIERCFEQVDNFTLSTLLNDQLLLTSEAMEQCWVFIDRILTGNMELMVHYEEQGKSGYGNVPLENVSYLMNSGYTNVIKLLPARRFGELRNRYAFTIMQACIYAFNKNKENRAWARVTIENAEEIATAAELKQDISAKLQEMNTITHNAEKKGWSFSFNWRIGLFLVYVIIKLATCNNSDSYSSNINTLPNTPQNTPVYITHPGDTTRVLLNEKNIDSFFRARH